MEPTTPTVSAALRNVRTQVTKAWRDRAVSAALPSAMVAVFTALYRATLGILRRLFVAIFNRLSQLLPLPV